MVGIGVANGGLKVDRSSFDIADDLAHRITRRIRRRGAPYVSDQQRISGTLVEGTHQGSMVRLYSGLAGLDAGRVRFHRLPADHDADRARIRCAAHRGHRDLHGHADYAPGRCDGFRLVVRPYGAPGAADDLHPVVLDLQPPRRLLTQFYIPVCGPCTAGHRDGRGMAGRCGAGDGVLASAVARLHVRCAARLMGAGLRAVGRRLRLAVLTARSLA